MRLLRRKHSPRTIRFTSNHIHLLVRDTAPGVISQSIQLIAGRTGRDYNQRKARKGAYWEDRYHATAVEADEYLRRCLVYIDLNMVRAGEAGGVLDMSLRRTADQLEKDASLKRQIRAATIYPTVTITFAFVVLISVIGVAV